jgi:hypothetical protein
MPPEQSRFAGRRATTFRVVAGALVLLALACAAFETVRGNSFILYDDPGYVTDNAVVQRGMSAAGLTWAFTTGHGANWHPLTWVSHMLDVELFGMDAGAQHLVNLLGMRPTLLLGGCCCGSGMVWLSFLTAALFAVHPPRGVRGLDRRAQGRPFRLLHVSPRSYVAMRRPSKGLAV